MRVNPSVSPEMEKDGCSIGGSGRHGMSGRFGASALAKGLGALLAATAAAGLAYETIATARDAWMYPAPGHLVDVGGYRLHLTRAGVGGPAVVLDAGLAGFS